MTRLILVNLDHPDVRAAVSCSLDLSHAQIHSDHVDAILAALAAVSEPFHLEPGDQVVRKSDLREVVRQLVAERLPVAGVYERVCDTCLQPDARMHFEVPPRATECLPRHEGVDGEPCPSFAGHWRLATPRAG